MKLSVEVIAAHQDLLLSCLPDKLAPRWQLLSRLASEQAGFKAEDHLTALAILSDQEFVQAFQAEGEGVWTKADSVACIVASVTAKEMCLYPSTRQCCLLAACTD